MPDYHFLVLTAYFLFFAFITWHRFNLGLALLFFLLPSYLIRFTVFGLPTTVMEGMILIILIIWTARQLPITDYRLLKRYIGNRKSVISNHRNLFIVVLIFLLAATISVFTSTDIRAALGEWKAFYIEPFLLFLILTSIFHNQKSANLQTCKPANTFIFALILSGLATSILAIYQHFTGWMVPWDFWGNGNSFRVTGWYGFPNGVGLYLAPLYPISIYLAVASYKKVRSVKKKNLFTVYCLLFTSTLFLLTAPLAIFFAKSTGALVGLAAGIGLLLVLNKKSRWPSVALSLLAIIIVFYVPSARQELLFQDRSGQIRLSMWSETVEFLKDQPLFGAGLASYKERIKPYHTEVNGEGIEIFGHPHNIFLTMWVNLGLVGLIGFLGIVVWFYKTGLRFTVYGLRFTPFLISSMTIILTHGLVDSPYIKNDLAIIFWLLVALMYNQNNRIQTIWQKKSDRHYRQKRKTVAALKY